MSGGLYVELTSLTTEYGILSGIHAAAAVVCLALFIVAIIVSVIRTRQYCRYKHYNQFLKEQLLLQKQLYKKIDTIYDETRIMRHDTKHYLTAVLGLIINEDYKAAEQLIMDVIGRSAETSLINYGPSNIINTVLNVKQTECRSRDISVEITVSGRVPREQELNIAVILSNLLDNAMEASVNADVKKIWVDMYEQKGMFYLMVKNTINGQQAANYPRLESTKKDKKHHGIGILSVKTLVKDADGSYERSLSGDRFTSYVTIPFNV